MKNYLITLLMLIAGNSYSQNGMVRDIDGNAYPTVMIGKQEWMAANLNTSKFSNGDPIIEVKSPEEWNKALAEWKPAWCYYGYKEENGKKYGRIYNYFAVMDPRGLAPADWHIPNEEEWNTLINQFGDPKIAADKLKSKTGWKDLYNGTNESGFNVLPAGEKNEPQGKLDFFGEGYHVSFWSSSIPEIYVEGTLWGARADVKTTGTCFEEGENEIKGAYNKGLIGSYVRCIKGSAVPVKENKVSFIKCITLVRENQNNENQPYRSLNNYVVLSEDGKKGIQMNFLQYDNNKAPVVEVLGAAAGASNCIKEGNVVSFLFKDGVKLDKENAKTNCESGFSFILTDRYEWNLFSTKELAVVTVNTDNGKVEEKVSLHNSEIIKTSMQCLLASRAIASTESYTFDCSADLSAGYFTTPMLMLSRSNKAVMINYINGYRSTGYEEVTFELLFFGMDRCVDKDSKLIFTFRDDKQITFTGLTPNCNGEMKPSTKVSDEVTRLKTREIKSIAVITARGQLEEMLSPEKSQIILSAINCRLNK